jgi:hypothetical protein
MTPVASAGPPDWAAVKGTAGQKAVTLGRYVERLITRHLPTHDAAGPARNVASRSHDVISTVIDIAHHLHPTADLTRLGHHLPVQLELGIPPGLIPLATHAGSTLGRPGYLDLLEKGSATPQAVLAATDNALLACVSGSHTRLRILRDAAAAVQDLPDFAEILPAAND